MDRSIWKLWHAGELNDRLGTEAAEIIRQIGLGRSRVTEKGILSSSLIKLKSILGEKSSL